MTAEHRARVAESQRRRRLPDARGNLKCHHCTRWLPATMFRLLSPPSFPRPRWESYCVCCRRELDRLRWAGERRETNNKARVVNQRKQQRAARQAKNDFGVAAVLTLRKRGLTKADIRRLLGVSWNALLAVEARRCRVTAPMAGRFVVALRETAHLPTGAEPAYRRRKPLPGFAELVARVRPLMDAYPLRSRWTGRAG